VVVDGRVLLRDGRLAVADEQQIMARAGDAARRLFSRAGISTRVTEEGVTRRDGRPSAGGW